MEIERLTAMFGAKLTGVDLGAGLSDELTEALVDAVHAHGVVFVPGQHLDEDQQLAVASAFGEPSVYPALAVLGGGPVIQPLVNDAAFPPAADMWHTDVTWCAEPPRYGMLSAVEIPPVGGDTLWVDTAAAFDALAPAVRDFLVSLDARHHSGDDLYEKMALARGVDDADKVRAVFGEGVDHPLVCTVPETGRQAIFIARHFTSHIVGLSPLESQAVLDLLFAHCESARFQVRWHWSVGDLVIWDERRTMHYAMGDYFPERRELRRCTVNDGRVPARA